MTIIVALVALLVGGGLAWVIASKNTSTKAIEIEAKAESILATAKSKSDTLFNNAKSKADSYKRERELEAKEKFHKLKNEHRESTRDKDKELDNRANDIKRKEQSLDSKIQHNNEKEKELEAVKKNLASQVDVVKQKQEELKDMYQQTGVNMALVSLFLFLIICIIFLFYIFSKTVYGSFTIF